MMGLPVTLSVVSQHNDVNATLSSPRPPSVYLLGYSDIDLEILRCWFCEFSPPLLILSLQVLQLVS